MWSSEGPVVMFTLARGGGFFSFFPLVLLLDISSVMGDSDVQAYYFYLERKKNMVCSPFSLRSCSFIMFPACLGEKLLSAWKGVAGSELSSRSTWELACPWSWGLLVDAGLYLDEWGLGITPRPHPLGVVLVEQKV